MITPSYDKLICIWLSNGLKTGIYYLRTKVEHLQLNTLDEECLMCGA